MMRSFHWLLGALLLLVSSFGPLSRAHAGGLFLLDRGSRPLSRGGAFVAGADDPHSLWYNPAGLARSKNQLIADFTLPWMFASYTRLNTDGEFAAKVDQHQTPLPIPTLAFSHTFGLKNVTFGAGIFAPNTVLLNWPKSVPGMNGMRDPGPTRYSLLGLRGSILSNLALGLAWHGVKGLSIGADVQVAFGRFRAQNVLSAYDGFACSYPEQPDCDVYTTLDVFPAWGLTGVFGIQYDIAGFMTIGASATLPYQLRGSATLDLKKPSGAVFQDAYFTGKQADFSMWFPTMVRAGVELRPAKFFRMEGAFVWEQWSKQQSIDVNPSEDIYLRNIVGITDYQIGPVQIPRKMRDTWSLRGGFELEVPDAYMPAFLHKLHYTIRGGLAYERSAFAPSTTTPMTLDSNKWIISGGTSFNVHKRVKLDGMLAYAFMKDLKVRDSAVYQPSSIRPAPGDVTPLGNGNYKMAALIFGGGLTVTLK